MEKKLTRTEIKKAKNYEALLNAGKALFAEKGFQNTTIKDITDYCDVGYGTFYLYFDSKEALLDAAVDELSKNLIEYKSVRVIKGLSIRERMYYGTKDILEFVLDNKGFIRTICKLSDPNAESAQIAEKIWEKIFDRMFSDHSYFVNKGYSNEEIALGSVSWNIYGWALRGIIDGIVSNEVQIEEIDKISRIYADMNYFTFIKEDVRSQGK